jgi:hypothetical protein
VPPPLAPGEPWLPPLCPIAVADDFTGAAGDLAGRRTATGDKAWSRTLGRGVLEVTGRDSVRVRASRERPNPGRTFYVLDWDDPVFADLEVEMVPPGTGPGQGEKGRCGFVFWQDERNHVMVNVYLDDYYAGSSISSFFHLDGFEELYDAVWSNVARRVTWGRPFRLRMAFDGMRYLVLVDDEPVLYRALTDVYPDARPLELRRVGLVVNWEWGEDTGSEMRRFRARAPGQR